MSQEQTQSDDSYNIDNILWSENDVELEHVYDAYNSVGDLENDCANPRSSTSFNETLSQQIEEYTSNSMSENRYEIVETSSDYESKYRKHSSDYEPNIEDLSSIDSVQSIGIHKQETPNNDTNSQSSAAPYNPSQFVPSTPQSSDYEDPPKHSSSGAEDSSQELIDISQRYHGTLKQTDFKIKSLGDNSNEGIQDDIKIEISSDDSNNEGIQDYWLHQSGIKIEISSDDSYNEEIQDDKLDNTNQMLQSNFKIELSSPNISNEEFQDDWIDSPMEATESKSADLSGSSQLIKRNCRSSKKPLLIKPKCSPDNSTEVEIPSDWFNSPMSEKNTNDTQVDDNEIDDTWFDSPMSEKNTNDTQLDDNEIDDAWFDSPLESTNDTQVDNNEIDDTWFDSPFSEDH